MNSSASGNRLAIGLLVVGAVWMLLRVSGLFRFSPVQFPSWAGIVVGLGVLAGPPVAILAESLHWVGRLIVAAVFLGCAFVFPWFHDQLPIYFWLTVLLLYGEVFGVIPFLLKRRKSAR